MKYIIIELYVVDKLFMLIPNYLKLQGDSCGYNCEHKISQPQ